MLFVSLLLMLFSLLFMKVDVTVNAHGYLQIKNKNIVVEHQSGGRIEKMYVTEGEQVKQGQVLAVIDNSYVTEEYNKSRLQVLNLTARKKRLLSELNDDDFAFTGDQSSEEYKAFQSEYEYYLADKNNHENEMNVSRSLEAQKQAELDANKVRIEGLTLEVAYDDQQVKMISGLVKIGAAAQGSLLAKKSEAQRAKNDLDNAISDKDVLTKELSKLRLDTSKLDKNYKVEKQTELLKLKDELSDAATKLAGASERKNQDEILSPVNGKMQKVSKSHEGSLVAPGGELFEIAPTDVPVVAAVRLETRDRDKVWTGMKAKVEINGLNKVIGDSLSGTVGVISADSLSDEHQQTRYYEVEVKLDKADSLKNIYPGMSVDVYINTGSRSISEYLLKPMLQGAKHAFSEP